MNALYEWDHRDNIKHELIEMNNIMFNNCDSCVTSLSYYRIHELIKISFEFIDIKEYIGNY